MAGIKPKVEIEATLFAEDIRDISGNTGSIYEGEIWISITKHTGVSDFSYFHTAFSGVEAPDFKSEIKKANDDPDVKNLVGFKTSILPKVNVDDWESENALIHFFYGDYWLWND